MRLQRGVMRPSLILPLVIAVLVFAVWSWFDYRIARQNFVERLRADTLVRAEVLNGNVDKHRQGAVLLARHPAITAIAQTGVREDRQSELQRLVAITDVDGASVFALAWLFTPDSLNRSVRRHLSEGMTGLGSLHAEILVFAMANLLATGIGVLVATGTLWVPDPDLYWMNWLGLAAAYFLIMSLGIHPLVIVLVAVNVMPAAALGVSTLTYAVLILGLWTSSTIGSPMSANNLMFSRQLGVPVWRLAWVWNMPAALLNFATTVVLGLVLQQIGRLG